VFSRWSFVKICLLYLLVGEKAGLARERFQPPPKADRRLHATRKAKSLGKACICWTPQKIR
jgi:hypothetical protein